MESVEPKVSPDLRALVVPIDSLVPDPRNSRTHDKRNLATIARSLDRYGQQTTLVVGKGGLILKGNGTWLAAKSLGWSGVAVSKFDSESPVEQRSYKITDNRSGELADWDAEILGDELRELLDAGEDLSAIGWETSELSDIFGAAEPSERDDALPDIPPHTSKAGDLWLLGKHRILCGDSTREDDVEKLLAGALPLLAVTDPPYGVSYEPEWRNRAAAEGKLSYGARRTGPVLNDDNSSWPEAWRLFPGSVVYCFAPAGDALIRSGLALEESGFEIRSGLIWKKSNFPLSRGHYTYQHEPIWYAVRKGKTASWCGPKNASSVWDANLDRNVPGGHSTQKPVSLFERAMLYHDAPEVYEPFAGSGTALVAAEKQRRVCYAMEIHPAYVDVSVRRWEEFSGKQARLEGGGTFAEVHAQRGA